MSHQVIPTGSRSDMRVCGAGLSECSNPCLTEACLQEEIDGLVSELAQTTGVVVPPLPSNMRTSRSGIRSLLPLPYKTDEPRDPDTSRSDMSILVKEVRICTKKSSERGKRRVIKKTEAGCQYSRPTCAFGHARGCVRKEASLRWNDRLRLAFLALCNKLFVILSCHPSPHEDRRVLQRRLKHPAPPRARPAKGRG